MTTQSRSTMASAMLRHGLLVLFMLIASLTAAALLHAREFPDATVIECSGYVHSEGDADQSPGDTDKAMPYHQGHCHGGAAFIPSKNGASTLLVSLALPSFIPAEDKLDRWSVGPNLRPPIA